MHDGDRRDGPINTASRSSLILPRQQAELGRGPAEEKVLTEYSRGVK